MPGTSRPLRQLARHAHAAVGDADFALAARQAHGHAGAAADDENLLMAVNALLELGDGSWTDTGGRLSDALFSFVSCLPSPQTTFQG